MTGLADGWERAWYGPVATARTWLVERAMLALLALDIWLVMLPKGARYGVGDFNVAHFAWLDAVQPLPTPALYLGVVLACALLAAMGALGGLGRAGLLGLAALYTWGWAMSQLDSYQHHYFLSWLLLALALWPRSRAADAVAGLGKDPPTAGAWGFRLLGATLALLYAWTGASKLDPAWRSGAVLEQLHGADDALQPLLDAAAAVGLEAGAFFAVAGHALIAAQWLVAAAYLSTVVAGERPGRAVSALRWVGLAAALAFHGGAELLQLQVGWFSGYMVVAAVAWLLPATWLHGALAVVTAPWRVLVRRLRARGREHSAWLAVLATLLGALTLEAAGSLADLPGAAEASFAVSLALIVGSVAALVREGPAGSLRRALAGAVAGLAMAGAIGLSEGRYDFYRYQGGDAARRGDDAEALRAYGLAETYAPEDRSRRRQIDRSRRRLGR